VVSGDGLLKLSGHMMVRHPHPPGILLRVRRRVPRVDIVLAKLNACWVPALTFGRFCWFGCLHRLWHGNINEYLNLRNIYIISPHNVKIRNFGHLSIAMS